MDKLLELETELELKALRKEIEKLREENQKYKKVILDNELGDEVNLVKELSPEEQICMDGIKHLVEIFKQGIFEKNDVSNFDLLHKNLRLIQGKDTDVKKKKKFNVNDALKIVEGYKEK